MNILLLNQCFYPDVVSTAQHLTDLAVELTNQGHKVSVIASDRGYDDPLKRFLRSETWKGIEIIRIPNFDLGKRTRLRRALSFGSFLANCALRLLRSPRFDAVIALTSPPLVSFLGALFVQLKGGRFLFWVMDLNPDEAIAAGWLKEGSLAARILDRLLNWSLRKADRVVVLDRFMKKRILARGIPEEQIAVVPPWADDAAIQFDSEGRKAFREKHGLIGKFVVMYSGNHSPCHPLNTLIAAANRLGVRKDIVFCFVGGGSEKDKVEDFAARHGLKNILSLPYQPFEELSGSLSAADLHTVVMGNKFVGIVHPCKVYNILAIGSPFIYIGPAESPIADITAQADIGAVAYPAQHGDVDSVVRYIVQAMQGSSKNQGTRSIEFPKRFSKAALLPQVIEQLQVKTNRQDHGNTTTTQSKSESTRTEDQGSKVSLSR